MKPLIASPEKLFDTSYIEKMCRGNQEAMLQIHQLFLELVPEVTHKMETGLATGNLVLIERSAHHIKPVAMNYGIPGIGILIDKIEILARSEADITLLRPLVQKLTDKLQMVSSQLAENL
jgi:HPt (histidine-containing phosphotransfer) domain-containing protein